MPIRPENESGRRMIILSYKYRLLPTKKQHRALENILEDQRQLYNAALDERIDCYRKTGRSRSYIDQQTSLTECRRDLQSMGALPANLQRWTLRRLDGAYQGFFRRVGKDGKAGFPRFRGRGWWRTFGFSEFSGIRIDGKRLRFKGLPGGLRMHLHREMPDGKPLSCTFSRDTKGWAVSLQFQVACDARKQGGASIGIDMGLAYMATLSDGTTIPNPRHARRVEQEMRRRQRHLARCRKGSIGRRKAKEQIARLHRKIADSRSTHLHQVSAAITNQYDLVAIENLNIKGLASGMLAKSVNDVSWGNLHQMLVYKAARAGCQLVEVDPRYTSQTCPECGQIKAKTLSERIHRCDCGCVMDRDHAAAMVILGRAGNRPGTRNVAGYGERAARNICEAV